MPVSISGSGSITGVSSLTQLTKLGVTGILTATDFSGPSGGAADFPNGLTATTASFSSNLTATTASFSSNLSVGGNLIVDGVLTYDDVTNIDSVGVVTARAGVKIPDSQKVLLGTGDDLEIFHNGGQVNEGFVDNKTGNLNIRNFADDKDIVIKSDNGSGGLANYILCDGSTGAVELSHYGSLKLSTAAGGVNIGGNLNLNGADNYEIRLGANNDLKLYHDGTDSWIDNTEGDLYLRTTGSGDDIIIRAKDDVLIQTQASEGAIIARGDGQVELYYNNDIKFETTSTGVKVNGDAEVTGSIGIGTDDPETSIKLDVRGAVIGNSFGSSLLVTPSNALTPSWKAISSGSDPSSVPSGLVSVSSNAVLSQGTSEQIFLDLGSSVNSVTFDFSAVLDTNFYYPGWKVSNNGSSWTNKGAINTNSYGVITLTDSNPFRYVTLRSLTNYNGGTIATVESTTTTPSASEPDTNTKINFPASDTVAVETGGTERLRITSTGLIDASSNTNAVALPQGTTAQRPTGSAPYIRKNTTNNALEYFDGTSWVEIITDYFPTGSVILG